MQRDRFTVAAVRLANAANDRDLAVHVTETFSARSCFHAQQAAEMALKALLIAIADDRPRTHVGGALVSEIERLGMPVPPEVARAAIGLDLFYMSSRYADALGGADPRKVLQAADARHASERASLVIEFARREIGRLQGEANPS